MLQAVIENLRISAPNGSPLHIVTERQHCRLSVTKFKWVPLGIKSKRVLEPPKLTGSGRFYAPTPRHFSVSRHCDGGAYLLAAAVLPSPPTSSEPVESAQTLQVWAARARSRRPQRVWHSDVRLRIA